MDWSLTGVIQSRQIQSLNMLLHMKDFLFHPHASEVEVETSDVTHLCAPISIQECLNQNLMAVVGLFPQNLTK